MLLAFRLDLHTLPSDSRALYAQTPIFVVEIMAQRSASVVPSVKI